MFLYNAAVDDQPKEAAQLAFILCVPVAINKKTWLARLAKPKRKFKLENGACTKRSSFAAGATRCQELDAANKTKVQKLRAALE